MDMEYGITITQNYHLLQVINYIRLLGNSTIFSQLKSKLWSSKKAGITLVDSIKSLIFAPL